MYDATHEQKYLDIAEDLYGGCCTSSWSYSWDSKGAYVLEHGMTLVGLAAVCYVLSFGWFGSCVLCPVIWSFLLRTPFLPFTTHQRHAHTPNSPRRTAPPMEADQERQVP